MVRRRTCPGVDGRKQRFSRFSAQKLSNFDEDENEKVTQSSDEEPSLEDTSGDDSEGRVTSSLPKKKRVVEGADHVPSSSSKRSRRLWHSGTKPSDAPKENVVVDTSILSDPSSSPRSVFDTQKSIVKHDLDADDDSSANKKNLRLEMLEQSMIVSEVAMKLEEFARKAMKGRVTSRTRRGVAGVVTPPWGTSPNFPISSRGLLTYDDEYENEGKNVIADGEDSLTSENISVLDNDSKQRKLEKELLVPPVPDIEAVKRISNEIRHRASFSFYHAEMIHACANVSEFFMSTPPNDRIEVVCNKVLQLFTSSSRLAADFHFYRAALHPENAGDSGPSFRSRFEQHHAVALRRALEAGASRRDTLREFKIFAVNLIYKLLGKNGSFDIQKPFSAIEYSNLLHTAEAWSKSVGTIA
jgi:hypothetical protein